MSTTLTSSPLRNLQERIRSKVDELFFPYFLKIAVDRHCNGNGKDCDCNYCNAKRIATAYVANTPSYIAKYGFGYGHQQWYKDYVNVERDCRREEVRKELEELRKEVL